jgi:hypothetical protein
MIVGSFLWNFADALSFWRFSKDTIRLMNFVSWKLRVEKKAIIVEILDEDKLHEAMALASSPFAVIGETPQQSAEIFLDHQSGKQYYDKSQTCVNCWIFGLASS